jgi:hypothetical protein
VNQQFVNTAFRLSATNEPFGGPILTDDAFYVISYNKMIPSEIPSLDSIRDRVVNDYKELQSGLLSRQAGMAFHQNLTNGLAQGKSFDEMAKAVNLKVVELPPFSLSTQVLPEAEGVSLNQLKQMAFGTEPGKASAFSPTMEGGAILFVKAKLPLDDKKMTEDLPAFARYVRQTRQNEAFNEWFRREAERGLRDTPLARPQTPDLQQQPGTTPARPS